MHYTKHLSCGLWGLAMRWRWRDAHCALRTAGAVAPLAHTHAFDQLRLWKYLVIYTRLSALRSQISDNLRQGALKRILTGLGPLGLGWLVARGAVEKKMTKVTYICRSAKKKGRYLLYFVFIFIFIFYRFFLKAFFGRFVTRGVQKHGKKNPKKSIWAHHKKCGFFSSVFFFFNPRLFCSIFFYRVFGRSVTRGVQKRDKKKSRENLLSFQKKYLLTYVTFYKCSPLKKLFLNSPC
jgi:hypothetical protein